jgi:hypothetical protein
MLSQQFPESICTLSMFLLLHGNDHTKLGAALACQSRHVFSGLIVDKDGGVGPNDQVTHILCREIHIQRHNHAAAVHCAKVGHQPLVGGHPYDSDMAPLLS